MQPSFWMSKTRTQRLALVFALLLSLQALIQANHRAGQGRSALLKWQPAQTALAAGEPIYQVGAEGYPTLPFSLLVMRPFHALGERGGALAWALLKIVLAWWLVASTLRLAAGSVNAYAGWGQLLVLLLCFRVLLSDILHGNTNILVAATVVAAASAWQRGKSLHAGAWIGVGAVLKVTPAFALVFFLWRRSWRALAGFVASVIFCACALPGALLGWRRNVELVQGWWQQMVVPYVSGRELGITQTEHINQSLLGVLARLSTDSVAIVAKPPGLTADVYVNVASLTPESVLLVHAGLALLIVGLVLWFVGPQRHDRAELSLGGERPGAHVLAEFSLLALAMLVLSERSWKHHFVLIALPLGYLVWHWSAPARAAGAPHLRRLAAAGVLVSACLHGLSGSGVLGQHGSNLAEAYGVHLWGALVLLLCTGVCLRRARAAGLTSASAETFLDGSGRLPINN